jgi:hypothetical protein
MSFKVKSSAYTCISKKPFSFKLAPSNAELAEKQIDSHFFKKYLDFTQHENLLYLQEHALRHYLNKSEPVLHDHFHFL